MKQHQSLGFGDLATQKRMNKKEFFFQIDKIVNWQAISKCLNEDYFRGKSKTGRPSYDGLLLFKICLLQTWYNLSDYEVEDAVNDRLSFSRFVGLSVDVRCPDHSIISRFRTALTKANVYEKLLDLVNQDLEQHHILIKKGALVDASITDSPRCPRGKKEYVAEDVPSSTASTPPSDASSLSTESLAPTALPASTEATAQTNSVSDAPKPLQVKVQKHVDTEASWVKKNGKLRYGYKKHVVTTDNGLVLGVTTTKASVNEVSNLEEVIDKAKLPQEAKVKADKGYQSEHNENVLKGKGLRSHIMKKAYKNTPLKESEKRFNKLIGKVRYQIERTFGSMVRWFGAGKARYVGKAKTHSQHIIESIAYNLYRAPRLIMANPQNHQS